MRRLKLKRPLLLSACLWTCLACSHPAAVSPSAPSASAAPPVLAASDTGEALPPSQEQELARPNGAISDCIPLDPGIRLPYFMNKPPVIVIGFLKPCTTEIGEAGFQRGSSWTAMGFPCTQGRGRIDRRGNDNNPNLITFMLQTSCPMVPSTPEEVERAVRERWKLPMDSKLIAYYPLSIDYWEFVQYPERDTGFSPQLYTPSGINQAWQRFSTKNEALRVKLYGRENAWDRGRSLYEVEADIIPESRSFFRLQVLKAKGLSNEERDEVKQRCESLRPKRNCEQIFD